MTMGGVGKMKEGEEERVIITIVFGMLIYLA